MHKRGWGNVGFGLLFCLWIVTAVAGLVLLPFDTIAVLDPSGAQLANDANPFGPPRTHAYHGVRALRDIVFLLWPLPFVIGRGPRPTDGFGRVPD